MNESDEIRSAEWYREQGILLYLHNSGDEALRSQGLHYLLKAHNMGDPEASYIVATLILKKIVQPSVGDPEEHALSILCRLADKGHPASRRLLNGICYSKYESAGFRSADNSRSAALTDFEGKPVKINCKGLLTPVDAELKYIDGKNILQLSANLLFYNSDDTPDRQRFEKAVSDGIMEWQGEYTVFGGQALSVEVLLTTEPQLFDSIIITSITKNYSGNLRKISDAISTKANKERLNNMLQSKRSFAAMSRKWSVRSGKYIYIQSEDDSFTDYDEIKAVAKHEFGHVLGLGDLYCSPEDELNGVEKGTYRELDSFYVSNKFYNLVMCDHHGPVSNNDIEMLLLAFRDNEAQLYQPGGVKGRISEALGMGN